MSGSNRAALINKIFKTLKKYYKPVQPPADRTLLEHLLYACCLENATFEAADEAFAKLQQSFFDWNEVRVTTVAELSEQMPSVPDSKTAAARIKRCLQSVFESHYAFDIELLHKLNLGKAIEELEKIRGTTSFVIAYVAQNGLDGHTIPTCAGTLGVLEVLGLVNSADVRKRRVPGLERSIPKSKGGEFASLLHQLGADFQADPQAARVRTVVLEIVPEAKPRLVAWVQRLQAEASKAEHAPPAAPPPKPAPPGTAAEEAPPKKAASGKPAPEKPAPEKPAPSRRKKAADEETGGPKSPTKQLTRKKPR